MEITYDYYRIFYYVAKYKSFSGAAEALMSNQPNITRFMNNLEHQLGCQLFIRSNRGVTLTPEGEKLYVHVAAAYKHLHAAETELANDTSLKSGIVTIGTNETALYGALLQVLTSFHGAHPGIRLHILSYSTPQAIQALKKGLIDMAVVSSPAAIQGPLKQMILKSYREVMIGDPAYASLAREPHHLTELSELPLISLVKDTSTYHFFSHFYLRHHMLFEPDIEAATASQILPLIEHGLGIGFIPEFFTREALAENRVTAIPLIEELPVREILLVKDTSHPLNVAANALMTMLQEQAAL